MSMWFVISHLYFCGDLLRLIQATFISGFIGYDGKQNLWENIADVPVLNVAEQARSKKEACLC